MIVLFICWFGSFVFEGDGAEDVWGGRVGRGQQVVCVGVGTMEAMYCTCTSVCLAR